MEEEREKSETGHDRGDTGMERMGRREKCRKNWFTIRMGQIFALNGPKKTYFTHTHTDTHTLTNTISTVLVK